MGQWSLTPPIYLGPEYVLKGFTPECLVSRTIRKGISAISISDLPENPSEVRNISISSHFP